MKYLKKFNETNEYDSFKNSDAYILPNVSFVVNANTVMFAPAAKQNITFYVDDIAYSAPCGITWREYVYLNDEMGLYDGGTCIMHDEESGWISTVYTLYLNNVVVRPEDKILNNSEYYLIQD